MPLSLLNVATFVSPLHHTLFSPSKPNIIKNLKHFTSIHRRSRPTWRKILCKASVQGNDETSPSPSTPINPIPKQSSRFIFTRYAIFTAMAITYATYVALRATFTYIAPVISTSLNLSLSSIGQISSAFPITYGMSRLFTGVIIDRSPPHLVLAAGLFLTGVVNVLMGSVNSISLLTILWGLNGLVQGVGAGSSAKMLMNWFNPKERGFYWALWSTSANIGGFLAPIVCGSLAASKGGFRAGMIIPGVFAMTFALLGATFMKSSPKQMGFAATWNDRSQPQLETKEKSHSLSWRQAFVEGVLKNRVIWLLSITYFFVYFVRSGLKSWLHFWLLQAHHLLPAEAAYRVSGVEIGGIAGTFSAGIISDWAGGRRVAVTIMFMAGLVLALGVLWATGGQGPLSDFVAMAAVGFMINGPQMMIGLIGAEVSNKRVVATATGVLGWISYLGAASSGMPLAFVIQKFGWVGFFTSLLVCSVASVMCLLPLWKLRAHRSTNT